MTILVGYDQGQAGAGGVQLGAMFAESLGTDLVVATVVPRPWATPSLARVDAEFASWTDQVTERAQAEVTDYLSIYPPELRWSFLRLDHRTASSALLAYAREIEADALFINSGGDGQQGQVVLGSTGNSLLHRSSVPIGISPRGYRSPHDGLLTRVTVAVSSAGPDAQAVLTRARGLADRMAAPMRVVTFAVRASAMYPPLVGLGSEDAVLAQWQEQAHQVQAQLAATGGDDTTYLVAAGRGWREAMDSIEWLDGEVLFLGSTREGLMSQVFIGSRATKIIRHSPVPALVLPR